jgi:hypothetical protein
VGGRRGQGAAEDVVIVIIVVETRVRGEREWAVGVGERGAVDDVAVLAGGTESQVEFVVEDDDGGHRGGLVGVW